MADNSMGRVPAAPGARYGDDGTSPDPGRADSFEILDEEEFDPFAPDVDDIDAQAADEVDDLPVVKEMPESHRHASVFDKSRFDSPRDALRELFRRNPGRRQVFLAIIDFCNDPHTTSEVAQVVEGVQRDNFSVYTPLSLCRILESAGALRSEVPESADEGVDEDGAEYLEVRDAPEATWTSTEDGLEVLSESREGSEVRELVESESQYREIYERLLGYCAEQGRTSAQIGALVDGDPLVQSPRRYGIHFVDGLEACGALVWRDRGWHTTELGQRYLDAARA